MKAGKKKSKEIELEGKVVMASFGEGSKSEHEAVCLRTANNTFKLRRMEGNPFHDPELIKWIGKNIVACGILDDYLFVATELREKESSRPSEKPIKKKKD